MYLCAQLRFKATADTHHNYICLFIFPSCLNTCHYAYGDVSQIFNEDDNENSIDRTIFLNDVVGTKIILIYI